MMPGAAIRPALPTLRQIWFQLHWFVGITAGTVLMVIGLTGATLAFEDEILDLLNPGVRHVAAQAAPPITPERIVAAVTAADAAAGRVRVIRNLTMFAEPGAAAKVQFAALPGERRGASIYVHPYSGALQPDLRGEDALFWIESLHRWILLPREPGRVVLGTLALCLMGLALSGLYLRWPRRMLDLRTWLTFDVSLKGRSFLWGLHSVLGTWALLVYLMFTSTGLYWSFDAVRGTVDGWAGVVRAPRAPAPVKAPVRPPPGEVPDLALAWGIFQQHASGWRMVNISVPDKPKQAVQFSWLGPDSPHDRARNKLAVQPASGKVTQDEHYAQLSMGARAVSTIYPLHVGSYFGLPGRIVNMLAALSLPVFGISGWLLYLNRRKSKRAALAERARLDDVGAVGAATSDRHDAHDIILLAYASQSGQAERIALHNGAALRRAGLNVVVHSLAQLAPADLGRYRRALFVASSFGEGEPPDASRRFARQLREATAPLPYLHYAVLALGDRHYAQFCGFGHTLDDGLRALGAHSLFAMIEVDNGDSVAMARWAASLAEIGLGGGSEARPEYASGVASSLVLDLADDAPEPAYAPWRLAGRRLLNPGSQGGPLYEVTLTAPPTVDASWLPGALVEVLPRQPPAAVGDWLSTHGLDGDEQITHDGAQRSLAEVLARSVLPASLASLARGTAQASVDHLRPLAPRSYSIASLPDDGAVQLLIRQERHEHGLGLASGWLTALAPLGAEVELRLLPNPAFAPAADGGLPCIYIGNGSGFAGLRSHVRARAQAGHSRNWLLYGERQREVDRIGADDIAAWHAAGMLERVDLVFSRDADGGGYVQDRLRAASVELRVWLAEGALLFVCGSLQGMAGGIDAALTDIIGAAALEELIAAGRYRRDVY